MKKVEILKTAVKIIIPVGVGAIVKNGINATSPSSVSGIKNLCIGIGAFVLSNMVSDKAVDYAEEKIDEGIKSIKEMIENGELN